MVDKRVGRIRREEASGTVDGGQRRVSPGFPSMSRILKAPPRRFVGAVRAVRQQSNQMSS